MEEYVNSIILGDCLEFMRKLPDKCVDLILTDPPYFCIVDNEWDNQWASLSDFCNWVEELAREFRRILKPHGALYWFCDDKVAAYCQIALDKHFHLLNNLVWKKPTSISARSKLSTLRSYAPCTERCLFYEMKNGNKPMTGLECIHSNKDCFASLKRYMREEREKVKKHFGFQSQKQFDEWVNMATGTSSVASRHYFADSQYMFATREHYEEMHKASGGVAFCREYEELRREYEELRREYEELRREYEELRRPWNNSSDADEILCFSTSASYGETIHPTQKPVSLISFMLERSTRPGFLVLDPFSGSGTTAIAAHRLGLNFIGIEKDAVYHEASVERLRKEREQLLFQF